LTKYGVQQQQQQQQQQEHRQQQENDIVADTSNTSTARSVMFPLLMLLSRLRPPSFREEREQIVSSSTVLSNLLIDITLKDIHHGARVMAARAISNLTPQSTWKHTLATMMARLGNCETERYNSLKPGGVHNEMHGILLTAHALVSSDLERDLRENDKDMKELMTVLCENCNQVAHRVITASVLTYGCGPIADIGLQLMRVCLQSCARLLKAMKNDVTGFTQTQELLFYDLTMSSSTLSSLVLSSKSRVGGEESRKTACRLLADVVIICIEQKNDDKFKTALTSIEHGMIQCLRHHWCPEVRAGMTQGLTRVIKYSGSSRVVNMAMLRTQLLSAMSNEKHGPTYCTQLTLLMLLMDFDGIFFVEPHFKEQIHIWTMLKQQGILSRKGMCTSPDVTASAIRVVGRLLCQTPARAATDAGYQSDIYQWFLNLVSSKHPDIEIRHAIADALSSSKLLWRAPSAPNIATSNNLSYFSCLSCWDALLQLMQDDAVNVRISARRAACESMKCDTMMLASKTLRDAYEHIVNVCSTTTQGSTMLHSFLISRFTVLVDLFYTSVVHDDERSAATTTAATPGYKRNTTMNVVKVFDDERENFFAEPVLEIELLYKMFQQLGPRKNEASEDKNSNKRMCSTHCGVLLKEVLNVLESSNDLMYFSNEKRFRAVYGTLLYLDAMCATSQEAAQSMRQDALISVPQEGGCQKFDLLANISISTPSSLRNVLKQIEQALGGNNNSEPKKNYIKDQSIFRV
jgi:hypothetical protein